MWKWNKTIKTFWVGAQSQGFDSLTLQKLNNTLQLTNLYKWDPINTIHGWFQRGLDRGFSPPSICQTILVMVNFVEPSALPTQRENFLDPRMWYEVLWWFAVVLSSFGVVLGVSMDRSLTDGSGPIFNTITFFKTGQDRSRPYPFGSAHFKLNCQQKLAI